jgi:hypothetical protein
MVLSSLEVSVRRARSFEGEFVRLSSEPACRSLRLYARREERLGLGSLHIAAQEAAAGTQSADGAQMEE